MYGWFRRLLVKKESPQSSSSPHVQVRTPPPSVDGASSLVPTSPPNPPPRFLSSMIRWSQTYDLCVCHSPVDIEEAILLATYLEKPARGLRCFLRQRDASVGGAIPTELCQAVQSSHCWALLITPNFLLDDWCQYMMHQALSEGPMSNRIIPLVLNLSYSQYPKELRFYYYKDLSKNPERGYTQVYKTVLKYLEDMDEKMLLKLIATCTVLAIDWKGHPVFQGQNCHQTIRILSLCFHFRRLRGQRLQIHRTIVHHTLEAAEGNIMRRTEMRERRSI
uniref:toll/interleukin-1 receptor domain-containing adapter protein n=1 Tax=Oncorhynchus gorbuscha TaxID=8017 RepID=UPI001EAEE4DA|nr:toll/interleukin-1 receptor domain-containing adapter protein [Oncorhynchus gorbuscha]